ncbi:MAG: isoprenylcysteine carboxylmethyltransferase family protein [bacterium]
MSAEKFKNLLVSKRVTFGYIFAVLFVIFAEPPSVLFFVIGLEIVIFGEAVRIWASGYVKKGEALAVNGPYGYVRHPLYLGSFLVGTGFCVAAQSINLFILFLVLFGLVYRYAAAHEEKSLQQKFGVEFVEYKESVPFFLPAFSPYSTNILSKFGWDQVMDNKEYRSWYGILIITAILGAKLYLLYKPQ